MSSRVYQPYEFSLSKLKPESTRCFKNPEKSVALMRQTQIDLIAKWKEMKADSKTKWLAIAGVNFFKLFNISNLEF